MNILSCFDGISCARVGIERAGIVVDNYYASEVDKFAIQITQKNYPSTVQVGDIQMLDGKALGTIDLLIGGSPCQDLSINNKYGLGLDGAKSGLFFEFVRLLDEVKPGYFILENVASMTSENRDRISATVGVEPVMLNASLVSAQNRKRLFLTNIGSICQPEDAGIMLKDIIQTEVDDKYYVTEEQHEKLIFLKGSKTFKSGKKEGSVEYPMTLNRKSLTILTSEGLINRSTNCITDFSGRIRRITPIECERLQSLDDNYTLGVSDRQRYKTLGNAFNADIIAHIVRHIWRTN